MILMPGQAIPVHTSVVTYSSRVYTAWVDLLLKSSVQCACGPQFNTYCDLLMKCHMLLSMIGTMGR